jgi:YidC/Oxa1 family membrane protein insertase
MGLNDNTLNKQQTQKRILLATLLSFAFFIGYDFLYLQPKQEAVNLANEQNKKIAQQQAQNSNTILQNNAPAIKQTTQQSNPSPIEAKKLATKVISTIATNKSIYEIDAYGRISQVTLKESKYVTKDGKSIKLFSPLQLKPLEIRFADPAINEEAFKIPMSSTATRADATKNKISITLTQKLTKTTVTKVITFYPDGHYDVSIKATNNAQFFITPGFRPNVIADMYADHGALLALNDGTLKIIEDEDMEKSVELIGVNAASAFDRYYTSLLYNYNRSMQVSVMMDNTKSPNIFIHGGSAIDLSGYAGPKEHKLLSSLNPKLVDVIEYGWFTFIAKPVFSMLQFIQSFIGNWGWTIVFTTIFVKLVLFPLSHKGMVSMNKLKELAPKVKALQEKYKDDKQKASMHMMELYKKEGANPMGGCLPVLLQIPIFFGIYRVLLNSIELKGAAWILWIDDLGSMDPYFVLPILMGATMYFQQRITPNTMTDPVQQKMFQFLPVVFTFFFLWFPAGLTLYWFINNLFTIGQQYYVNTIFEKAKIQRHEQHEKSKHKHNKK